MENLSKFYRLKFGCVSESLNCCHNLKTQKCKNMSKIVLNESYLTSFTWLLYPKIRGFAPFHPLNFTLSSPRGFHY